MTRETRAMEQMVEMKVVVDTDDKWCGRVDLKLLDGVALEVCFQPYPTLF